VYRYICGRGVSAVLQRPGGFATGSKVFPQCSQQRAWGYSGQRMEVRSPLTAHGAHDAPHKLVGTHLQLNISEIFSMRGTPVPRRVALPPALHCSSSENCELYCQPCGSVAGVTSTIHRSPSLCVEQLPRPFLSSELLPLLPASLCVLRGCRFPCEARLGPGAALAGGLMSSEGIWMSGGAGWPNASVQYARPSIGMNGACLQQFFQDASPSSAVVNSKNKRQAQDHIHGALVPCAWNPMPRRITNSKQHCNH
jgi:hypothetical protein